MQRVHAVEHDAGRAGAGERGGDFLADVAGFADADHDDFAAAAQRGDHGFDRAREGGVELGAHGFEGGEFDVENLASLGQMVHRGEDAANAG